MVYGSFDGDRWGYRDSVHASAVQYIRECLKPMNEQGIYWSINYAANDPMNGLWQLSTPTLHKLIGIMHSISFSQDKVKGRHGRERFVPDICSANYKTKTQRKAAIDSVYHFLYLVKDSNKVDVGILHDMLRGLPCNKKNFVNCSLPVRRNQVEAMLKFMIASISDDYRDLFTSRPRGISIAHDGTILINSPELVDLLWRRHEDVDRIITMFIEEGTELGILEERLDTHAGLDAGVL